MVRRGYGTPSLARKSLASTGIAVLSTASPSRPTAPISPPALGTARRGWNASVGAEIARLGGTNLGGLKRRTVVIMMPHDPRRFVPAVDFVTSPGLYREEDDRVASGRGGRPPCLITPRARFSFAAGELTLDGVVAGFSAEEAVEGIPWTVPRPPQVETLDPPDDGVMRAAAAIIALDPSAG